MQAISHAFAEGDTARFDYPVEFTSLPEHSAHRGQTVTVIAILKDGVDYDYEGDAMYRVRAGDGWEGSAWESELVAN